MSEHSILIIYIYIYTINISVCNVCMSVVPVASFKLYIHKGGRLAGSVDPLDRSGEDPPGGKSWNRLRSRISRNFRELLTVAVP